MAALFNQALVAALLASTAVSSPISTHINDLSQMSSGKASIKQVRNPNYHPIGPLSVKKTYLKFGKEVPDWLEAAVVNVTAGLGLGLSKRATGTAKATPIDSFDDAYITPVSIGTPPQVLNLDFDTGSSDLWVFSSETPVTQVNGQLIYTPSKSSTAKLVSGATWSIAYGDGSTSAGDVYTDTVNIGGVTVANQAVESAQKVSTSFTSESAIDGLVGLAFSTLNTVRPTPQKTFFDNAKASLNVALFTVSLAYHAAGTYNFGYIDTSQFKGAVTFTPVTTTRGYWEWVSTGYAIGSGAFTATSIDGIADTGTSLLYLPAAVVQAYYAQIPGAVNSATYGGYVYPCATTPPSFTFGVQSATITIPGTYFNFGAVSSAGTTCFGGMQSSAAIGINIFGDVALKAAFVVFDQTTSTPRLGWAVKP